MKSNTTEIEAAEWLARLDRNDSTPADLAEFDRWKAADPRRVAAYVRLAATWQALDRIQAIRPRADEPIDDDYLKNAAVRRASFKSKYRSSFDHYSERSLSPPSPHPLSVPPREVSPQHWWQPSLHRRRLYFLSVPASLLLCLWVAHMAPGPQTFGTTRGGFQRIVLEDRSVIELNTDSEVRVLLSHKMRLVELVRGEASFEVAHDTSRPFIVSAGNTAVRAIGTKFDVRWLDNAVEVIVDEGKVVLGSRKLLENPVNFLPPSAMLSVVAGQAAITTGSSIKLQTLPKDGAARKLAWKNQVLVFDGDSLTDVVAQFNRYNERQLVIVDSNLATLRIGGYFRSTNLDAFINALQSDFGVRVKAVGSRLELATTAN